MAKGESLHLFLFARPPVKIIGTLPLPRTFEDLRQKYEFYRKWGKYSSGENFSKVLKISNVKPFFFAFSLSKVGKTFFRNFLKN